MTERFNESFWLGTAASAHTVEGGCFGNDWWHWEQRPGRIADGSSSKTTADHFNRFKADFQLARKLGCRAHLFVLEWSRIQPCPGQFDQEALRHYHEVFVSLRENDIQPVCILSHVTQPQWFADAGGWHSRHAAIRFHAYSERIASEYASFCKYWIPFLEPMPWLDCAYLTGSCPPAMNHPLKAARAAENLLSAHVEATRALRAARQDVQVGLSVQTCTVEPEDTDSPWDLRTARREQRRANHWLIEAVQSGRWPFTLRSSRARDGSKATVDFICASFDGIQTVRFAPFDPSRLFCRKTPSVHEARTRPFASILKELGKYGIPLLVLGCVEQNGGDAARCSAMLDELQAVMLASREGVEFLGYLFYSLLDGFEWREGLNARKGIIHVDYDTLARTPNNSAYLLKDISESRTLRPGAIAQFCPGWTPEDSSK